MNEDINQEILIELRKLRKLTQRMYYFFLAIGITFFVIAVISQQSRNSSQTISWQQVRAAVDRGDCQKALSMAKALVARQPDFAYGHAYLGYVYLAMDDLTSAEAQYLRAYELFPNEDSQKDLDAVRKRLAARTDFKLMSK